MITKQQALEFIYDLSQKTEVMLDVSCGEIQFNRIVDGDYSYTSFANQSTLEATVTKCIKEHMDAIMNYVDKIPIEVDMLEVGQTYKVELNDFYDGCHSVHIAKYIGKKEEYYYFENRHTWRYEKEDLYQLWKMNNKEMCKVQGE